MTKTLNLQIIAVTGSLAGALLIGLSVQLIPSTFLLIGLAGVIGGVILLQRPIYGLYAVMVSQLAFVGGVADVTLTKMGTFALTAAILGFAVLWAINLREIDWKTERSWLIPLLVFLGWCGFNVTVALSQNVPITTYLRELFPLLNYGLILAAFVWVRTTRQLKQTLIIVGGVILLIVARDLLFNLRSSALGGIYNLIVFIFLSPGSIFYSILGLLFGLLAIQSGVDWRLRLIMAGAGVVSLGAIFLSGTRGFWLGAVFAILIWFRLRPRLGAQSLLLNLMIFTFGGAFLLVMGSVFFPSIGQIELLRGDLVVERVALLDPDAIAEDRSVLLRISETEIALTEAIKSPIFGRGLGFEFTSPHYSVEGEITRGYVHNFYVFVYLKLGLIGLGIYLWLFIALYRQLWHIRQQQHDWNSTFLATALLVALLITALISVSSAYLNATPTTLAIGILLGACFGAAHHQKMARTAKAVTG